MEKVTAIQESYVYIRITIVKAEIETEHKLIKADLKLDLNEQMRNDPEKIKIYK